MLRGYFAGSALKIMFDDLPNVDRILQVRRFIPQELLVPSHGLLSLYILVCPRVTMLMCAS